MSGIRVLIAGGGTGGHLYPGIAVARELVRVDRSARVTFAGTARGIESRVIPREGFELDLLRSAALKRAGAMGVLRGLGLLPVSALDAWRIISRRAPDVVVGVGGYSSGPVVLVAALRRIPTLLLEQNAAPGFTNRVLARVVSAAAVTFDSTVAFFGRKGFVAGNPVRPEFFQPPNDTQRGVNTDEHGSEDRNASRPARILIFGGSQGAHAINMAMVAAAPRLAAGRSRMAITHQTGERDLELVRDGYRRAGIEARVEPFLYAMDREMKAADLVICRAGATTIAELTAAGKPAIFVPLPTASDDHQRRNAEVLVSAGAGEAIEQKELTGERLAERIAALVDDSGRREAMAAVARRFARPDAARVIVDRVRQLAARRQ